jgi:hypothetical protein
MIELIAKDNLNVADLNNVTDFFHTVVPISYCSVVLLDKAWVHRSSRVQTSVRRAGLLTHKALVFRIKNMSDCLSALERFTSVPPSQ